MNRRILFSGILIFAVLAIVTGAALAYFLDIGTSSGNSFSTGTLSLKLTDTDEVDLDSVNGSFGASLNPGQCTGNRILSIKNTGTILADHLEIALANDVEDVGDVANPDISSYLRINNLTYNGVSVLAQITDTNTNEIIDLADWAAKVGGLDNLSLTELGTSHDLVLDVCLDSNAPNEIQGDSVDSTFTVTLNQHASQ